MIEIHTFGGLRITRNGLLIAPFSTRKVEALLVYLACQGRPCPRETLADLLWDDRPQAQTNLRATLSRLKQHLPNVLTITRHTIAVNPANVWLDVAALEAGLANTPSDSAQTEQALALYGGDFLAGYSLRESRGFDDWLLLERERLRGRYLDTLLRLIQQLRSQSEYERAIEVAQKALASDNINEHAYQHLMFCHMALGNRPAALEEYEKCDRALRAELAVEPTPETQALYLWIKQTPSESPSLAARITNLPIPLTSFIGRKRETREIKESLAQSRLVTLAGAGGSGKTRLAIQVATDLIDSFKHGVWWVDLAPLLAETLAPQAVAKALGVREAPNQPLTETLIHFLREKHVLLILDNCEHLVNACAQLANDLLIQCPNLKILATSREILRLTGEQVFAVPTLSVPDASRLSLAQLLLKYESVRLFVDRARAIQHDFVFDDGAASPVARICYWLEGIPLAIELAAARSNALTVHEIAVRLDDRFNLLTMGSRTALPRQQTLRAAIAWSYELLLDDERLVLRQLSVFAGGWTLEAAEAICVGDGVGSHDVLDILSRLVNKSMALAEQKPSQKTRYHMLETIRQYAHEKLLVSGELERTQGRHLDFFLKLVEDLQSTEPFVWLDRLAGEHDNLRAAMEWSLGVKERAETGARLVAHLAQFWDERGHFQEGRKWLEAALAHRVHLPEALLADVLHAASWLACRQGDYEPAIAYAEESVALGRRLGDKAQLAGALRNLGGIWLDQVELERSIVYFEEALALFRELDDKRHVYLVLSSMTWVSLYRSDHAKAASLLEECLTYSQQFGNPLDYAQLGARLGIVRLQQGQVDQAERLLIESLKLLRQLSAKPHLGLCLQGLAGVAVARSQPVLAARLLGIVEGLLKTIGMVMPELGVRFSHEPILAATRAQLDEAAFAAARAEGQVMTVNGWERAIEYALAEKE